VEVGIRPEDIEIGQSATALRGKVEMISNIGSEKYLHVGLGNVSLTVRAPKEAIFQPGQIILLTIDPDRLHIFHEGRRI